MKYRRKKLMAWIVLVLICMQSNPMLVFGETMHITTDYTLTSDESTDGYVVTSGGVLRFGDGVTVNGEVTLQSGENESTGKIIIPSTATMNANIIIPNGYYNNQIENSGAITFGLELVTGTIVNRGRIQSLAVTDSGILYSNSGASYGVLDVSASGSGAIITAGELEADTLLLNGYGVSTVDSSATTIRIKDLFAYTGSTDLPDMISILLDSKTATKITTEGQEGLSVYYDGIKYPLPAVVMNSKTLSDIYSASQDKSSVSFEDIAVGYQTVKTDTVNIKNSGMADLQIKLVPSGAWSDIFTVESEGTAVAYNSAIEIAAGDNFSLKLTMKKGLEIGENVGTMAVQLCTSEGVAFDTANITGKVTVEKIPSIDAPSDFYTLSGTKGNNGFYISDVKVIPKSGYQIAKMLSDEFADTVTYSTTVQTPGVYLIKSSTGQITEKATVETIKIDKDKPDINRTAGKTYYSDMLSVKVADDYLYTVTVNDKAQTVQDDTSTFNLKAEDDKTKYTIKAEDKAGNVKEVSVYLYPKWREDGVVPGGKSVKLYKGKKYAFGSGTWTASGDTTNYVGGNSFYVKSNGEYTINSTN